MCVSVANAAATAAASGLAAAGAAGVDFGSLATGRAPWGGVSPALGLTFSSRVNRCPANSGASPRDGVSSHGAKVLVMIVVVVALGEVVRAAGEVHALTTATIDSAPDFDDSDSAAADVGIVGERSVAVVGVEANNAAVSDPNAAVAAASAAVDFSDVVVATDVAIAPERWTSSSWHPALRT